MYEDTVCTATHKMVIKGCLGVGRGEAKNIHAKQTVLRGPEGFQYQETKQNPLCMLALHLRTREQCKHHRLLKTILRYFLIACPREFSKTGDHLMIVEYNFGFLSAPLTSDICVQP